MKGGSCFSQSMQNTHNLHALREAYSMYSFLYINCLVEYIAFFDQFWALGNTISCSNSSLVMILKLLPPNLIVCSCHVTYAFQSESTLYSYLNVKELLVRSRREIWRWSNCNFLDIQTTIKCGLTLKPVRGMTRTYNQMYRTDKYSEHSSVIWPVWPNG